MNRFTKKRFLNKDGFHGVSAISTSLEYNNKYTNGDIEISDCNRSICLDISFVTEEELENSMFKCQQLIEAAEEMKKFLIQNGQEILKKINNEEI